MSRGAPLVIAVLVSLVGLTSAADLWANYQLAIAEYEQAQWRYAEQYPSDAQVNANQQRLQHVVNVSPLHAQAHQTLADTGYWLWQPETTVLTAYKTAQQLRPYWGEAYANEALLQLRWQQATAQNLLFTEQAQTLMVQAQSAAPNEHQVKQSLLELGVGYWSQLSREQQADTIERFQKLVNRGRGYRTAAVDTAEQYGMKLALCTVITTGERPPSYCR